MDDATRAGSAASRPIGGSRSKPDKRCTPFDVALGARIRARRALANMGQPDLAQVIGVTFQQVQKYEQGRTRVAAGTLQAIADALGLHPGVFFDGDMPAPPWPGGKAAGEADPGESAIPRARAPSRPVEGLIRGTEDGGGS